MTVRLLVNQKTINWTKLYKNKNSCFLLMFLRIVSGHDTIQQNFVSKQIKADLG